MKRLKYILLIVAAAFAVSCHYNDEALMNQLKNIEERIKILQPSIDALNSELIAVRALVSGNAVTQASLDSDGNLVVKYKDENGKEKSVVVAGQSHMINVPFLGIRQDGKTKIYYWTITQNGVTMDLLIEGQPVPVAGKIPTVSVNSDGNWTVDGVELLDNSGNPIEARNGETCVFRSVGKNANGDLEIVQGNGNVIVIPLQNYIAFTLDCESEVSLVGKPDPFIIHYTLSGERAADARVSIVSASNLTPALDTVAKTVSVSCPSKTGTLVLMADDMAGHIIIRPVFFGEGYTPVKVGLSTVAELKEFVSLVNAGSSYQKYVASDGAVHLLNNIDVSSVSTWTPIGNGTVSADGTISGKSFTGNFYGDGYTISGFKGSSTAATYGFFGILKGATVTNLTLSGTLSVGPVATASTVGSLAGAAFASNISNVTVDVAITAKGTSVDNIRFAIGGIVGTAFNDGASGNGTIVANCINNGNASITNGSNTKCGMTSVMYGGIAGASLLTGTLSSAADHNQFNDCVNNGKMTATCGRCSGIVASCYLYTYMKGCTNNGSQTNSANACRLGQLTSELGKNSRISESVNEGDIIVSGSGDTRVGGLVGAMSAGSLLTSNSFGRVITVDAGYRGLLFGNVASASSINGNSVKGLLGEYRSSGSHVMLDVNASNYQTWSAVSSTYSYSYLGSCATAKISTIENTTFVE